MKSLSDYYRISEIGGLNIIIQPDNGMLLQLCLVKASNNKLDIIQRVINLNSLAQLKQYLPAKTILAVNLSGKGILQKISTKTDVIDQAAFAKLLPNGKLSDFHVQNFISGANSFVSVIRRSDAERWQKELGELGYIPVMLSLGPFVIEQVFPQLNIYGNEVIIDGSVIVRDDALNWTDVRYQEHLQSRFPFKLASEQIDERLVIPYAAAFQVILSNKLDPVKANVQVLDTRLNDKLFWQKLRFQSALILISVFFVLFVNFIVLSSLSSSNDKLSVEINNHTMDSETQGEMEKQIREKEARLSAFGWDGGQNKVTIIDQVFALMPPEIITNNIAVNPIDPEQKGNQKQLFFHNRRVAITGISGKIIPVNEWIARIKTKQWVKNVRLESFAVDPYTGKGEFTLILNY